MSFLVVLADLDVRAGRIPEAGAHLREALEMAVPSGLDPVLLFDCLNCCGYLCAATGRWAEAITLWAALAARQHEGMPDQPEEAQRRQQQMRKAAQALGPARTRAAEERGTAMTLETAFEFATMLTTPGAPEPQESQEPSGLAPLSGRERELVTLVARGLTNAQIAGQLFISVRTVGSHLDRIRDKTGCRRRADLTRLALEAGLV